ncbi:hypothetical protein HPP92_015613 [Vanilla planifolia]|uniref:Uncharacterized protein n=1 Tax=Vanilla planifolia TaxID=51239 RepID=A0A835UR92_VANPL|nr:hypothetical protein HPP92_015613 [Vanilla planifolia]
MSLSQWGINLYPSNKSIDTVDMIWEAVTKSSYAHLGYVKGIRYHWSQFQHEGMIEKFLIGKGDVELQGTVVDLPEMEEGGLIEPLKQDFPNKAWCFFT